jgi:hypothetical protein
MFVPPKYQNASEKDAKLSNQTPFGLQKQKTETAKQSTEDNNERIRAVVDPYSTKWYSLETLMNVC